MSEGKRLRFLLDKELDGELSPTELVELERLARAEPQARREREAWGRFRAALVEGQGQAPRIDAVSMSRRIIDARGRSEARAHGPGPFARAVRRGWFGRAQLVLAGVCCCSALAGGIVIFEGPKDRPSASEGGALAVDVPRLHVAGAPKGEPPVVVRVDEGAFEDDREQTPVEIRF